MERLFDPHILRTHLRLTRRFCPSVMVYLVSTVPAIWILELQLMEERIEQSRAAGQDICLESESIYVNGTPLTGLPGVEIPLFLPSHMWSLALQQTLLFVLIVGRWLLPKGSLTRDQLSQLLLVYIGIAADILEFSTEGLKMEEVRCDYEMVFWILAIWTWSLLQFTLGLTATKARKPRMAGIDDDKPKVTLMCCETEVWGLMTTIIMQDGPFLAMRLYILIKLNAINQMMIFFTCKNMLVMLLQVYRLFVIYIEKPGYHPQVLVQTIVRYTSRRDRGSISPVHRQRKPRSRHLEVPDIHESHAGQSLPLLPTISEKTPASPPLDVDAGFQSFDVPQLPQVTSKNNGRSRPEESRGVPRLNDKPTNRLYDPAADSSSTEPLVQKYPPSPARIVTFDDM
ncbi:transmembrane protein 26-like isoform X2 [Acanthaster planci]|uniref:Transmembrane protein 26-like isoform X2 n=1 Tax=Acanthaster planci TaxID=133434 RepID=A0A8B7ZH27_ACAPL|nr:transmembrane protein 26-like isoform X2 [Acanthaster planci]